MNNISISDRKRIATSLKQQIRKKHGELFVDPNNIPKINSISTGSLKLDALIGCNGLPRGRLVELFGPSGSGKSTFATLSAVSSQQAYPDELVLYVDCEQAFDLEYAQKLGLNISEDKFILVQPDSGVQALDIMEKFCEAGICSIIILDSVASLRTNQELNGDVGDQHMAVLPRLLASPLKNLMTYASNTDTCCLLVNQVRKNLG